MDTQFSVRRYSTLVLAATAFLMTGAVFSQVPAAERTILLEMFTDTNGTSWVNNSGWGGAVGTECSWFGITCTGGRVTDFSMFKNGLTGSLPASFSGLTELRKIGFGNNAVGGTLPDISNMSQLEQLGVGNTNVGGPIPDLSLHPQMKIVLMHGTQLFGNYPHVASLTQLERLSVPAATTGSLPDFSNNTNLIYLWASETSLTGGLPPSLTGLSQLLLLDVHGSMFSGAIPDLQTMASLQDLFLGYNMLTATDPTLIAFLDANADDDWTAQTVPPTGLAASDLQPTSVQLDWDLIAYTGDTGGYQVECSDGGSSFTGQTNSKTVSTLQLTSLPDGAQLSCRVRSRTNPHLLNPNTLTSAFSASIPVSLPKSGPGQITVDFSYSPAKPRAGEPVFFTDASSAGTQFSWSFGDGSSSTLQNPSHTYKAAGTYSVTLEVTDGTASGSATQSVQVLPPPSPAPKAGFEVTPTRPRVGETVLFLDDSSGQIDSYSWDFGDGGTSSRRSPTHEYEAAGRFTVSLEVSGPGGKDRVTKLLEVTPATESTLAFVKSAFAAPEGVGSVTIGVRLSPVRAATATVEIRPRTATEGSDYVAPKRVELSWDAGDNAVKTFKVEIIDDDLTEENEYAALRLVDLPSGTVRGDPGSAWLVIEDDDLEVEPEITVTSTVAANPDVAIFSPRGGGGADRRVLVWEASTGKGTRILAQVFDADGRAVTPQPFEVSSSAGVNELSPRVVFRPQGGFAVVWRSVPSARSENAAGGNNVGRFFNPEGVPESEEIELAEPAPGQVEQTPPSAGAGNDDELIVTWREDDDIITVLVDRDGVVRSPSTPPSVPATAEPQVARAPTGRFLVSWEARQSASTESSIFAQFHGPSGSALGDPIEVAAKGRAVSASAAADGGFVLAWESLESPGRIEAQQFEPGGTPRADRFFVDTEGVARSPSVAANAAGDFGVAWTSGAAGQEIRLRLFDRRGEALGRALPVVTGSADRAPSAPELSLTENDRATIAYSRTDRQGRSLGVFTTELGAHLTEACADDGRSLCLQDNRYEVKVSWRTQQGKQGQNSDLGQAVKLTDDTGYFWFFEENNVEMVIKVLDACDSFGKVWVFAGGLTDVEVNITVTDTVSGRSISYLNRLGDKFQPIQDIDAFSECDGTAVSTVSAGPSSQRLLSRLLEQATQRSARAASPTSSQAASSSCSPSTSRMCLGNGRFAVEAEFRTKQDPSSASARAVPLTSDTGYFWFFEESNVELVVKVLDGCSINQRYWVFAGGLTDVEVVIRVIDLDTGQSTVYENPLGLSFAPIQDTDALACP